MNRLSGRGKSELATGGVRTASTERGDYISAVVVATALGRRENDRTREHASTPKVLASGQSEATAARMARQSDSFAPAHSPSRASRPPAPLPRPRVLALRKRLFVTMVRQLPDRPEMPVRLGLARLGRARERGGVWIKIGGLGPDQ